ncbi:hypothetical protein [Proteus penneri]|uniref:hypothetical protein n=1 Tax=Proteus penneri TaxID=102862 RepID=UPI001111F538|nr:hypothetical protein [Proteus penneri]
MLINHYIWQVSPISKNGEIQISFRYQEDKTTIIDGTKYTLMPESYWLFQHWANDMLLVVPLNLPFNLILWDNSLCK